MFSAVTTRSRSLLLHQIQLHYSKRCQKKLLDNVKPINKGTRCFSSRPKQETSKSTSSPKDEDSSSTHDKNTYLHVGPSGDCWTGSSIFAAKHLQPDYVKSIKIDEEKYDVDKMMELLEDNDTWTQQIYDEESLPNGLLDALSKSNTTHK